VESASVLKTLETQFGELDSPTLQLVKKQHAQSNKHAPKTECILLSSHPQKKARKFTDRADQRDTNEEENQGSGRIERTN
jgi:hypothetical protein